MLTAFMSMIVFPLIFTSVEIIASIPPSGSARREVDKVFGRQTCAVKPGNGMNHTQRKLFLIVFLVLAVSVGSMTAVISYLMYEGHLVGTETSLIVSP